MNAVALWFRAEWRGRWRSLVGLLLLIAFATAGVSAAVAGARRSATSVDRLLARTTPATVAVLLNQGAFDWNAVRSMPGVEAVAPFAVVAFGVEGLGDDVPTDVGSFPPIGDDAWRTIETPVVLDGRLPDVTRADEVAMSPSFAGHFHKHVGDRVTLRLYTPEQIDAFDEGEPLGPAIEATIVGTIRSPWFLDEPGSPRGYIIPSPGLYANYAPNIIGANGDANVNAIVRLHDRSATAIKNFEAEFTRRTGIENLNTFDLVAGADHARNVTHFESRALLLLALAAGGTSVLLLGLALSRFCAVSFQNLEVLRAFGLTRAQARWTVAAAPTSVAVVGVTLGAIAAVGASRWFPIGSASNYETSPGTHVDLAVLVAVGVVMVLFVLGVCAWSIRSTSRLRRGAAASGTTVVARLTSAWPLRLGLGTRLAVDDGGGRVASGGRSALLAGILGVTGVVAALIFSTGVTDATDGYRRFGQTFELATFIGFGNEDFVDATAMLDTVADDPGVDGIDNAYNDFASGPGGTVALYSYEPVGAPIDVVVLEGRLPATSSEIALAPKSAASAGVEVGDTLALTGTSGARELTVTGLAFVPAGPHNGYADGGWVLTGAFDDLFDGFRFHFALVSTRSDVDPQDVADRLAVHDIELLSGPIVPPTELYELDQLQTVPLLLAGFLAILGIGAIAHALTSTARRRRHDFAMLRALGMRPRDTTIVVFVQAGVIALLSLVVGVPAGVLIGRALWRSVALDTPVQFVVPTAWSMLLAVSLAVILIAAAFATWPSHRLASTRPGAVLRSE